jgi:15-cis-phytoene synthase
MSEATRLRAERSASEEMELARGALAAAAQMLEDAGMARPELAGQLIRPLVAVAGWRSLTRREPTPAFWWGVLAVQLAHEASLLHDDVLDGAARRRGAPTVASGSGVGAALVQGDHLLTTAYRCATRTESPLFMELFARAVERTVAGEIAQARAAGRILTMAQYETITRGKAGELLGCALAIAPALLAPSRAAEFREMGCRFGVVYQMLDDLLDLSPSTDTGKPNLGDYAQRHWTWPLAEIGAADFGQNPAEIVRALHTDAGNGPAIERCLATFSAAAAALEEALCNRLGRCELLVGLLEEWRERAAAAVERERAALLIGEGSWVSPSPGLVARVPQEAEVHSYLARHSRSFSFATRFFSSEDGARVARVYAYCRCTDDLADEPGADPLTTSALLDEWLTLSRRAYQGRSSGIAFLDRVMAEMASARVPFRYAEELIEGMRMDVRGERYHSLSELRIYTYRVASVVGLWISELFDVRDPATLQRAEAMGHAMQLTNIIRDVGEDLRSGRCYIPTELLLRHGIEEDGLAGSAGLPPGYAALVEELIAVAETAYRSGFEGIPALPRALRLPVSVAAHVYRGILHEVRALGYDNLANRARTSPPRKALLAARAMLSSGLPWSAMGDGGTHPRQADVDAGRPV